jgi:rhamnopyranosyl-N-acetylglucosaminyl-diphospho-decaprenol beta-1,3/1,4-galactofuranosyltransferase
MGGTGRYHSDPSPTDRSLAVPQDHSDTPPPAPAGKASGSQDAPRQSAAPERVVAVTVTYRRPELLPRLLDAVRAQTRRPDVHLLIDNGGDVDLPGAPDLPLEIVRPGSNVGPAGGYAIGFREALRRGADRVWVLDDDAIPDPPCLEELLHAGADVAVPRQRRAVGTQEWLPWVGGLFDARWVERVGAPREDYFIWSEDYEYVLRLRRAGARVVRLQGEPTITHANPMKHRRGQPRTWRLYYDTRNSLHYRLRVKRATWRTRARSAIGVAKTAAAIVAFEPHKRRSLGLLRMAVSDYRHDRMGKRVDPETWSREPTPAREG